MWGGISCLLVSIEGPWRKRCRNLCVLIPLPKEHQCRRRGSRAEQRHVEGSVTDTRRASRPSLSALWACPSARQPP